MNCNVHGTVTHPSWNHVTYTLRLQMLAGTNLAFFGGQYLAGIYFSDLIALSIKFVVRDCGNVTITNAGYPILFPFFSMSSFLIFIYSTTLLQ